MTRAQIRTVLERAGVPTAGQAVVHVLLKATLDGVLVRGPLIGDEHAFVLAVDWLGERPKLDRERGLAELARRYLAGHGPADDRDLAKWAQVTLGDARAGLEAIAPELQERSDGLLQLRGQRDGPLPPPRLLGPFDPLLLGWRSRAFVVDQTPEVITTNGSPHVEDVRRPGRSPPLGRTPTAAGRRPRSSTRPSRSRPTLG